MKFNLLVKAYAVADKYNVNLEYAKDIVSHLWFATNENWTAEEYWKLKGRFLDRKSMEPNTNFRGNADNARTFLCGGLSDGGGNIDTILTLRLISEAAWRERSLRSSASLSGGAVAPQEQQEHFCPEDDSSGASSVS